MVVQEKQDGMARRIGWEDMKSYLVRRFGVQQATLLYGYHQMLVLRGPAEMQRTMGPERYREITAMLREAGVDV